MKIPPARRFFLLSCLVQAAALLAVLVPFLRQNNLLEWDFPGHFAAIWHLRHHLLPWHSGWNPYFYGGYPQGLFYPPLAHYLAALLSFAIGIGPAMKALVAASVLSLPFAFFAFARRAGLEEVQASLAAAWMTALLFISGEMLHTWSFGADLRSTLNVGLFANTLSLPLLFGFLACCAGIPSQGRWKGAALLLGLLLLTHPLSSLIALLFLFACLVAELSRERCWNDAVRALVRTAACGLLIGAPWLVPFAAFRAYMNTESVGAQWSPVIIFIALNGAIMALASLRHAAMRPAGLAYLLLANFILLGTMWQLGLQFTRLTVYLLFLLPLFAFSFIRSRALLALLALLALAVGWRGFRGSGIHPQGVADFPLPDFGRVEGRVLSVAPPAHLPSFHVNHDLVPARSGNASILGLFIEASLNGRFAGNLVRMLEPDAYVWGTPTEIVQAEALGKDYPQYVRDRLRLFDVRHIYTDLRLEGLLDPSMVQRKRYLHSYPAPRTASAEEAALLRGRYHLRDGNLEFYLYSLGEGSVAEALPYLPAVIGSDWKLTSKHWFLEMRGLPIFTDRPIPAGVRPARPGEWVEEMRSGDGIDRRGFYVHAAEPVPVFVKIGYFPAWKATSKGRDVPIYRAAPNFMLLFARGEVSLAYRHPWQEAAGLLLSLAGLAGVLFAARPRRNSVIRADPQESASADLGDRA